ncbi:MAG: glycosyltransferase [Gammaproteobacteria bacterium]|nr:MAG: glycosyltransferase [Gammaproteobacteria bacterium]
MGESKSKDTPQISVVIPVYNEEAVLPALFERLYPVLDALGRSYEVILVDDGSRDRSPALLRAQFERRPDVTRVVYLQNNFGQHAAILAGFKVSRGEYVITLDADLQNPPEEIPKLVEQLDQGHDYVGTIRRKRRDVLWRTLASRAMNRLRERITRIRMTDQGNMLRGYHQRIIDTINQTKEINTFIPALAYLYALNPVEIVVEHEERHAGESKYSLYRLIRLNFDLVTGFTTWPLEVFSFIGMLISIPSALLVIYMLLRRLIIGPEVEGVFTLFAINFFFIGVILFGIGLLGEYVGRIYQEVQNRPRYIIRAVLEQDADDDS